MASDLRRSVSYFERAMLRKCINNSLSGPIFPALQMMLWPIDAYSYRFVNYFNYKSRMPLE